MSLILQFLFRIVSNPRLNIHVAYD